MFMLSWQAGAEGSWEVAPWVAVMAWLGPTLLGAVVVFAAGKAWLRRHRYRAIDVLSETDRDAVHATLRDVERRTVGEIVPVVFERSDAHPAARWRAAGCAAVLASILLVAWLPWRSPHWLLLCQLGFAAVGALLATLLRDLKRTFVSEARATELAEEQAFQEFFRLRLHETVGKTGVLLFVSLFERRVIVLADSGIDCKVGAPLWTAARDAVLHGIARDRLRDGLIAGITQVGEVLARHCPWQEGDRNEVPDRLVVQGT
jgi:putative membrane protein